MNRTYGAVTSILIFACLAGPASAIEWQRAVYYDERYGSTWAFGSEIHDWLAYDGYEVLDADALKTWMDARIADDAPSVVVFAQDVAPETVAEVMGPECTLRRYLDAGGKIVWYADVPLYYQGHPDGTLTTWGTAGSIAVLGFDAAGGPWNSETEVTITSDGEAWGLSQTWASSRPASTSGLRVLATDGAGYPAAWVKHYVDGDTYRGFVRTYDRPGVPNVDEVRRLAVYPDPAEPLLGENPNEAADDIIAAFHYLWYGNPATSGAWDHWEADGHYPPLTWSANYAPDFPDSTWDPAVMLYDSSDPVLLRWQDQLFARAGLDIAVASWWGIGTFDDAALASAIRISKSVQWCIYHEMEAYSDPSVAQIVADLQWVIDRLGPTKNYAKVDGKWLVFVYVANDGDAASRWRQAKQQLRDEGYDVYINALGSDSPLSFPDPWDAIHIYDPTTRRTLTETVIAGDDSASVSPGFWLYHEFPWLSRDLEAFQLAWDETVAEAERSRFLLIETWNEWHEGTCIEPGQRIIHDDESSFSATGDDYAYDFIDAIAEQANALRWSTPGHRPEVPVRLEAETMVWELGSEPEGDDAWRILDDGTRIGASVQLPFGQDSDLRFTIRARGVQVGPQAGWPDMVLYWAGQPLATWTLESADYGLYEHSFSSSGGVKTVEVSLANDPGWVGDVDLVVDYVDVARLNVPAGRVPDGAFIPGVPLTLAKVAGDIALSWGSSCLSSDTDYGVYEGTIGTYDSHAERFCSSGGLLGITFTPGAGDHYYLVVPRNGSSEGSYGRASSGSERPPGSPACASQMIGACP
jgi:hypothetical protein